MLVEAHNFYHFRGLIFCNTKFFQFNWYKRKEYGCTVQQVFYSTMSSFFILCNCWYMTPGWTQYSPPLPLPPVVPVDNTSAPWQSFPSSRLSPYRGGGTFINFSKSPPSGHRSEFHVLHYRDKMVIYP